MLVYYGDIVESAVASDFHRAADARITADNGVAAYFGVVAYFGVGTDLGTPPDTGRPRDLGKIHHAGMAGYHGIAGDFGIALHHRIAIDPTIAGVGKVALVFYIAAKGAGGYCAEVANGADAIEYTRADSDALVGEFILLGVIHFFEVLAG